jgi:hypothetical protein
MRLSAHPSATLSRRRIGASVAQESKQKGRPVSSPIALRPPVQGMHEERVSNAGSTIRNTSARRKSQQP